MERLFWWALNVITIVLINRKGEEDLIQKKGAM